MVYRIEGCDHIYACGKDNYYEWLVYEPIINDKTYEGIIFKYCPKCGEKLIGK